MYAFGQAEMEYLHQAHTSWCVPLNYQQALQGSVTEN